MKIICKTPLLLVILALTSCTVLKPMSSIVPSSSETVSTKPTPKKAAFTLHYDYGNYRKDQITLLYDDCIPFFSLKDYGEDDCLAGDIVHIEYTGSFVMRSTYPSTAVLSDDFQITLLWSTPTAYVQVKELDILNHVNYSYDHPYVITSVSTLAYVPLEDYVQESDPNLLYASASPLGRSGGCLVQPFPVEAFYSDIPSSRRLSY